MTITHEDRSADLSLAETVERWYARESEGLNPEDRRALADTVKILRGRRVDPDAPPTSPRVVAEYLEALLNHEREGSWLTAAPDADGEDGPPWVAQAAIDDGDHNTPALSVRTTDGNTYVIAIYKRA